MDEPQQPVSVQARSGNKRALFIVGAIAVLVLILISAAALIRVDGFSVLDRLRAGFELRDVRTVERNYSSVSVNRFGIMSLAPVEFDSLPGTLSDYARGRNVEAGIVLLAGTDAHEVVLLDSTMSVLTGSASAKASLAVSPDGSLIAYATRTSGAQTFSPLLSEWTVRILDRETGSDTELGTGFGPQFFMQDGVPHLLFTTPEGIQVVDVSTNEYRAFTTPFDLDDRIEFAARVAPNGKYLAMRDRVTQQFSLYEIYRVASNIPLGIEPTGADLVGLLDVVFAGGSVYGVDSHDGGIDGGVAVLRVDPKSTEEGKPIYLFPASTDYRLIQ